MLTCENVGQALERSAPDETNKGREAAHSAVEMARLLADPSSVSGARTGTASSAGVVPRSTSDEGLGIARLDDGAVVGFHATQLADGTRRIEVGATGHRAVVVPWHRGRARGHRA